MRLPRVPLQRALSVSLGVAGGGLLLLACRPTPQGQVPSLCYERLEGQPGRLSFEQLRLEQDGATVRGTYSWYPWQKDRRVGRLEGRLTGPGSASVTYRFSQEGQQATAPLTISFEARQASIRWDPVPGQDQPMPMLKLPRRACDELQPVPAL